LENGISHDLGNITLITTVIIRGKIDVYGYVFKVRNALKMEELVEK
jgi:hypothetical protein